MGEVMNKSIKQIAEEMYTKPSEYEQQVRQELYNLENLLKRVGGTGDIRQVLEMNTESFLNMLIRNGITFELTEEKKFKLGFRDNGCGGWPKIVLGDPPQ